MGSLLGAASARAELVQAEPLAPISAEPPAAFPAQEAQVACYVVVEVDGSVSSAIAVSRTPADAPAAFAEAAERALRKARFRPSTRDGREIRSRVEYVVVFHADGGAAPIAPPTVAPSAVSAPAAFASARPANDVGVGVEVRAPAVTPRSLGEMYLRREQLEAAPHQKTSELLAAAPGFFVDHEEGEGLGNDVYLRGFDLEHGAGIEMRVADVPINLPVHVRGQGYADVDFIIPEVVQAVHVREGVYDPRQGDAAIVGSANFELGVAERGYRAGVSYGSFNQRRLLLMAAPRGFADDTFLALAARKTDGFGARRQSESAALNSGYSLELGRNTHLRWLGTAYAARSALPGVVRADDVESSRIGYYDSYPYFAQNQSVQAGRVILALSLSHEAQTGARFAFAPWVMWSELRARENYAGALESSQEHPALAGLGDLFETRNLETAGGLSASARSAPVRVGASELVVETGTFARFGQSQQQQSLLEPDTLRAWDRRLDARLSTVDVGGYVDLDWRLSERLRLSGGLRADLLSLSVADRLPEPTRAAPGISPAPRAALGLASGPRAALRYRAFDELSFSLAYGEGFRSLDAQRLSEGSTRPYSKVRSLELGLCVEDRRRRLTSTLAAFETWVENELVFVAEEGGLETQNASVRRGMVGSVLARPASFLLASSALSVSQAVFRTRVPGVAHYVPNVPPLLFRTDLSAHAALTHMHGRAVVGRVSVGYTFLAGRHLSDRITGPASHVLNAGAKLRYAALELGLEVYNALGLRYADNADVFISNWSSSPGQQPASLATHYVAAAPRSVLASLSIYFDPG